MSFRRRFFAKKSGTPDLSRKRVRFLPFFTFGRNKSGVKKAVAIFRQGLGYPDYFHQEFHLENRRKNQTRSQACLKSHWHLAPLFTIITRIDIFQGFFFCEKRYTIRSAWLLPVSYKNTAGIFFFILESPATKLSLSEERDFFGYPREFLTFPSF